jgi:hypothetical protein
MVECSDVQLISGLQTDFINEKLKVLPYTIGQMMSSATLYNDILP